MVVGVAKVAIHLPYTHSLKSKRQIIKRILQKVNGRFKNLAISEVEEHDLWQKAVLGFSTVGAEAKVINRVMDQVLDYLETLDEFQVIQADIEIISM